jgi:hypothetical protein
VIGFKLEANCDPMGACSAAMGGASACGTDEMDFARWLGPDLISNNETLAPVPEGDSKSEMRRVPTQTNTRYPRLFCALISIFGGTPCESQSVLLVARKSPK